jgi:hypothetical protein
VLFIEKEHAMRDATAARDGACCRGTIETTEDASPAMTAKRARLPTGVWLTVGAYEHPGSFQL